MEIDDLIHLTKEELWAQLEVCKMARNEVTAQLKNIAELGSDTNQMEALARETGNLLWYLSMSMSSYSDALKNLEVARRGKEDPDG